VHFLIIYQNSPSEKNKIAFLQAFNTLKRDSSARQPIPVHVQPEWCHSIHRDPGSGVLKINNNGTGKQLLSGQAWQFF